MKRVSLRRALALALPLAVAAASASAAHASQLIDRNAKGVKLAVASDGTALLTYRARGKVRHVLAWGAVNALAPTPRRKQVRLRLDYSGGWSRYLRANAWRRLENTCRPYSGPKLALLVAACTAADGSHWAVQSWRRALPEYALRPRGNQRAWELRLSHWTGDAPSLVVKQDWAYGRFHHLYGTFTFHGAAVFGFRYDRLSAPLDTWGREVYVDTYNSAYGKGWRRENGFPTRRPDGIFCYGMYPHGRHPSGQGTAYRVYAVGPGVAPDMFWQSAAPGAYDASFDALANLEQRQLAARSGEVCQPN